MKNRTFLYIASLLLVILVLCPAAAAAEEETRQTELTVSGQGFQDTAFLIDGDTLTYYTSTGSCTLTVESTETFYSLYLMFDLEYGEYTITDNRSGASITAGQHSFLHDFVPLPWATDSVTLTFASGSVRLSEISAYTEGTPSHVQIWQPPLDGETELLLLSTHGDDDQLYFAGLLPLYAGELGYKVQVAYLTDHRNLTMDRTHEMINGLWAVGVRNYPVFGDFADFRIDSLTRTYQYYAQMGTTKDQLQDFVVTLLRRFDPQVVVCHDFAGEYGHGMHQVYADLLAKAIPLANDPKAFPNSAEKYGLWDVPKAYFHLYTKEPIILDYDVPLRAFDGMTAFDVSRKIGFPCHVSQQISTDFGKWVNGEFGQVAKASQIVNYSPCYFGLYRSTLGPDVVKNDFMENTPGYNQRKEEEQQRKADAEEAARLEAEQAQQAVAESQAEELRRAEEKRKEEESKAAKAEQQKLAIFLTAVGIVALLICGSTFIPRMLHRNTDDSEK